MRNVPKVRFPFCPPLRFLPLGKITFGSHRESVYYLFFFLYFIKTGFYLISESLVIINVFSLLDFYLINYLQRVITSYLVVINLVTLNSFRMQYGETQRHILILVMLKSLLLLLLLLAKSVRLTQQRWILNVLLMVIVTGYILNSLHSNFLLLIISLSIVL